MMEWAWLIPSLPAIAFAFMVTLGKRLPNWSAIAATGSMAVSFVLFLLRLRRLVRSEVVP